MVVERMATKSLYTAGEKKRIKIFSSLHLPSSEDQHSFGLLHQINLLCCLKLQQPEGFTTPTSLSLSLSVPHFTPASLLLVKPVSVYVSTQSCLPEAQKGVTLAKGGVKKRESCLNRMAWSGLILVYRE